MKGEILILKRQDDDDFKIFLNIRPFFTVDEQHFLNKKGNSWCIFAHMNCVKEVLHLFLV